MSKGRNTWRPTARPPRSRNQNARAVNQGWILGLQCAVAVLNDDNDFCFTNEKLQQFLVDCDTLMYSMNNGIDNWRDILRKLEHMTGVRMNLNQDEKPQDGRFAIVDLNDPEADEYDDDDNLTGKE